MRSLANVPRSSDNHIGREELKMDRLVTDVSVRKDLLAYRLSMTS